MTEAFVDTSFWIAYLDRSDHYHSAAAATLTSLRPSHSLVTTNFVVNETLTYLNCSLKAHTQAVTCLESLRSAVRDGFLIIVRIDDNREERALDLFVRYNDKYFSVVDCTSFIVMQDRTIGLAMGFDSDFEQMGFQLLPHV